MILQFNNTLLLILMTLLLFCIGIYIYNTQNIIYYDKFENTELLTLMSIARTNAMKIIKDKKLKEKFLVDERQMLENDAYNYYNNINVVQSWLDNNYNGENGIISKARADIESALESRTANKEAILTLLTNIYIINYINYVNKQNAENYKMYLKYNDPKNNKFYNQYIN